MASLLQKHGKVPLLILISGLTYLMLKGMSGGTVEPAILLATVAGSLVAIAIQYALTQQYPEKNTPQIYLSYNNTDVGLGKTIAAALVGKGFVVSSPGWVSMSRTQSKQKVEQADVLLVILSRRHAYSKVLKSELEYALALGKRIVFIHTEDEPISQYQGLANLTLTVDEAQHAGIDKIAPDLLERGVAFA